MRLDEWCQSRPYGEVTRLSRVTGLSYGTVWKAVKGVVETQYASAVLLSSATGGAVSIAEICEPRKRKRRKSAA